MSRRILRVASREYVAYVRTKSFLLSAIALPVVLMIGIALPALMESMPKPPRTFTIIDETGEFENALLNDFMGPEEQRAKTLRFGMHDFEFLLPADLHLPAETTARRALLEEHVQSGLLFGFLRITAADSTGLCRADYYTVDPASDGLPRAMLRSLNRVVAHDVLMDRVGDAALIDRALHGVDLHTHAITEEGEEEATAMHIARSYAPLAFVYFLWLSVLMMSSHLMTSTIEEKASRIIEVLLSSVSPYEFMLGKLAGLGAAGLTTIGIYAGTGALLLSVAQNGTIQQIGAGLGSAFTPLTIFWFISFYLLGYLFFSAIFVGIGSVCNTLRDAQSLTQPIMFILMIPLFLMVFVTNNPDHIVAVIASFFPPFTPFVIMNRIPATPAAPLWQVIAAALLLLISTWLIVRAAAKVFRTGILMYGKPPTLPEILRWARQSH